DTHRRRAPAPVGRPPAAGKLREDRARGGLAAAHPARADAHRPVGLLATADPTTRVLSGAAAGARAPRVALVHDWLTGMRGGERCLEVFCELFPDAPLYTLLHVPGSVSAPIERRRIVTSFVQRLPRAASQYRRYLPLFPAAVGGFDLSGYDLVISLSHCVAKAVRRPPGALHLSYCFSPMRYLWDLYDDYFGARAGLLVRSLMPPAAAGPTVEFLGGRSDAEVAHLYARCRAVLFPAVEDYGIVPLEAAAAGRPTIALARGGALETMTGLEQTAAPPTAVFFGEQTAGALADAIGRFEAEARRFEPAALRARAQQF